MKNIICHTHNVTYFFNLVELEILFAGQRRTDAGDNADGIFLMHMPGAEAAGVGPVVDSPHSPNEKISIHTLTDDWNRFVRVLEAMINY